MKSNSDFIFNGKLGMLTNGITKWQCPSNIALVKYWGKLDNQIPANPSISFTLKNCHTNTQLTYEKSNQLSFEVWVEGKRELSFEPKIKTFLNRIEGYCPYLSTLKLRIDTYNSFPHSSGIASSASGLSALAMCIMEIEKSMSLKLPKKYVLEKASFLARLGSGSAARSVYPGMASWGESLEFEGSSDLVATPFTEFHTVFANYQDTVLLVDRGQKQVSSTVGHNLMNGHPFAEKRFEQAHENLAKLKKALIVGDLNKFNTIVESEALTLHAMMMTSNPYFILMKSNTLAIIEKIWEYRKEHNLNITITLDAGANVHVLYPFAEKEQVLPFIKDELSVFCEKGMYICDEVGNGAQAL
jgi:diphosphomevalonate decarboxylase